MDEFSDILGQQTKPSVSWFRSTCFLLLSFVLKLFFVVAFAFASVFVILLVRRARIWYFARKEQSRRRNLRRRYGIPDTDRRSFDVAYDDALTSIKPEESARREAERARKEAERAQKLAERLETYKYNFDAPNFARKPVERLPRISKEEKELLIQDAKLLKRFPCLSLEASKIIIVEDGDSQSQQLSQPQLFPQSQQFLQPPQLQQSSSQPPQLQQSFSQSPQLQQSFSQPPQPQQSSQPQSSQRSEEDFICQAVAQNREHSTNLREGKEATQKIVQATSGEPPMVIDDDEGGNRNLTQRGKKRDRAEAESTLGDDEDDVVELNADGSVPLRRKRRILSEGETDIALAPTRGQKRSHDSNDDKNEAEDENPHSHKRMKVGEQSTSKISTEHGDRAIGEEWVENNIKWKLGSNGELLRQHIARQKVLAYRMPADSVHPDRFAEQEVYVQKWFTKEEHSAAQSRHILIEQDTLQEQMIRAYQLSSDLRSELAVRQRDREAHYRPLLEALWAKNFGTRVKGPPSVQPSQYPINGDILPPSVRALIEEEKKKRLNGPNEGDKQPDPAVRGPNFTVPTITVSTP